jgi:hypothetical protein
VCRVIHGLKDNYRQIRPVDHEMLGVGRVIHGHKDNYRQIRPWYTLQTPNISWSYLSIIILKTMNHSANP